MGVSVFSDRSGDIPQRGDVGIAPYAENARFFVGADALIGPEGLWEWLCLFFVTIRSSF